MTPRSLFFVLLVGGTAAAFCAPVGAADPGEAKVKLTLSKAAAERDGDQVVFECEATLDNATGKALNVRSSFSSAFDGVVLVLFDARGKKIRMQPYTAHQSPRAPDGTHRLETGKTTKRLVFPVIGLPGDVKTFRVCLVGSLPGSAYDPALLMTDLIEVSQK